MISARGSRGSFVALSLALSALAAPRALADDSHHNDVPIGSRASGMGGAYAALSDDPSGMIYNPAGLAEADRSSISLSAAVYGIVSRRDARTDSDNTGGDSERLVGYPTAAAWSHRLRAGAADGVGRLQAGLSLIVPTGLVASRHRAITQQPVGGADSGATEDQVDVAVADDDALWTGLSLAYKVRSWLSVGVALHYTFRSGLYQLQQQAIRSERDDSGAETGRASYGERTNIRLWHHALVAMIGAVVRPGAGLRVGLVLRAPSVALDGGADVERAVVNLAGTSGEQATLSTRAARDARFTSRLPTQLTLALAWQRGRFVAALDGTLYLPRGEYAAFEHDGDDTLAALARVKQRLTWQLNLGAELYVHPWVPVRLGLFTNRATTESLQDCDDNNSGAGCRPHTNPLTDPIDLYGLTAAVGYERGAAALALGVIYSRGAGEVAGWHSTRSNLLLLLGGAVRYR